MTVIDTYLLLRAFCDELARCGMRHACTSPGSRCTPIVLSLASEPRLRCWSHVDERCAGFFALGAAKATGRPVAVTCTSGTAAANLAPAVIEARWAGVPLLVLTADRPPELREVGAGQTIDQLKLYGDAARWFFEVGVDTATPEHLRWMRTLACRAYWTALGDSPGVVHLNFPLREPLVLDAPLPADHTGRPDGQPYVRVPLEGPARWAGAVSRSRSLESPAPGAAPSSPHAATPPPGTGSHSPGAASPLGAESSAEARSSAAAEATASFPQPPPARRPAPPGGRPVIVAGAHTPDPRGLAEHAARAGIPLLADPLSGARRGAGAIAHYDLLLRSPRFIRAHPPDRIVRVGELPTSKPLRAWLASLPDVPQIAIDPRAGWQDPDAIVGLRLPGGHPEDELPAAEPGWLESWRRADEAVAGAVDRLLGEELCEPLVARRLPGWLPPATVLYIASSMPIRDVESFAPALDTPPRMLANRGANGIDGTVSSAFGAAADGGRVVLLVGDVALAHDIGGLLAARRLGLALTVVLLNNDGGGIFHFLPVAEQGAPFVEHVATPHGLEFATAARLYGCRYERPADPAGLEAALRRSLAGPDTYIIEVQSDRIANRDLHARLAEAALGALEGGR